MPDETNAFSIKDRRVVAKVIALFFNRIDDNFNINKTTPVKTGAASSFCNSQ